ncbi:elongation factor Tu [Tieghemostelium lacteum]|uniref:Elongation factor Tu n=1 Tax=Tieghemostelium lacteum TaxID=361077 RepID=A0A151ZS95_TIELA|nr:elongation factor Tu [Tieghemostelium lacteum]|eukprot:KYQ96805.1 elongation factor Tu [Tieghemostelium lacteum]
MRHILEKIIKILSELNGRDKIFKFIQYFSKILHYGIEKRLLLYKLFKVLFRFNDKTVQDRLEALEYSLSDARVVYRLGGFFYEFKSLLDFIRNRGKSIVPCKWSSLINFQTLQSIVIGQFELVDQIFSFYSEIADVIFWGTKIKIFKFKFISTVGKVSDFIWIYSLSIFMIRILYQFFKLQYQLIHSRRLSTKEISIEQKEKIKEQIRERNSLLKSIILMIGEFGLCICSIYEIENNLIIGLSGCLSALISLQEIWNECSLESDQESNTKNIDNNSNNQGVERDHEEIQHPHIIPPVVHIHSNP